MKGVGMALPSIQQYRFDSSSGLQGNRTSWTLEPARAVLLVHDMQEHFVRVFEDDHNQLGGAIARMEALVSAARQRGVPVVYTAQPPAQDPRERGLLTDFWGPGLSDPQAAAVIEPLAPREEETVLTKWRYSAFHRSELREQMRLSGRDQLIITGVYAHIGCLTTALVAFMEDIRPFFVADAMADFGLDEHQRAAEFVASRCGQVITAEGALAALQPAGLEERTA